MSLITLPCIYFSISQKQEEGNVSRKAIGVNEARQVFKNRCPIFWDFCDLEKGIMDMKEVLGRTQSSVEVPRAETDKGGTSWVLYLCCWS